MGTPTSTSAYQRDDRARRARAGSRSTSAACRPPASRAHFQLANITSFETVERMMRRGIYKGPLVMNWVAIGGGLDAPNIYNLANFVRAVPGRRGADAGELDAQRAARQHDGHRHGPARALRQRGQPLEPARTGKMSTVEQIEQLVRISREFGRDDRHRPGGARDLQDRRLLRHGRRDAGRPTASRPTATAASRASCARRRSIRSTEFS